MDIKKFNYLSNISSASDVKKLTADELRALAYEIRAFLIESVSVTGGHLASNLGVVELSIALHRVFTSPRDHIIWDVGHQCYAHKLLTGRAELFDTLRTPGGLSGFTKRSESEHDPFGSGHSSTSLSAGLGFALADRLDNKDAFTVVVIGDGAFTGGMVSEALNNLDPSLPFIIIFNENEMSISKNVGAFARYISSVRSTKKYFTVKNRTKSALSRTVLGVKIANGLRRLKRKLKNNIYGSNYFENIGLKYLGPVDGNDVEKVSALLEEAKHRGKSAVIHLITKKGFGYPEAEAEPEKFHIVYPKPIPEKTFSSVFGDKLVSLAEKYGNICAITAAMSHGCGLSAFEKRFPDRFFDVGIAEAHAATFAAGLAAAGKRPVFAVYSSFLQRSYDSIVHDIALQGLPVVVAIDRAGLAVADGPTHHGIFDVSFLSSIPNVELYAPASFDSLENALENAIESGKPSFIRYPSGAQDDKTLEKLSRSSEFMLENETDGCDCMIVTYGKIAAQAIAASERLSAEGINCKVIVLEKLLPYNDVSLALLDKIPEKKAPIIFLEEGMKNGGAGMNIYERIRAHEKMADRKFKLCAIEDFAFLKKGVDPYESCHLSASALIYNIKEEIFSKKY
ncbi:MAG: 1-deoxy-D-xylulose-5-phosphate synthase [Ruminococcaceae bacterium]|nr:1-deoxy-D-xylulose-5-phosphate synthase [Oscillospiraceae bacterium]